MMTRQNGLQQPAPTGAIKDQLGNIAPASWWESYFANYPLEKFVPVPRFLGVTINIGANTTNTGMISASVDCFAYAFRCDAFLQATGAAPTIRYRIGFTDSTNTDYTIGQWLSSLIGGNGGGSINQVDLAFPMPLELRSSQQITVQVNNNVVAAATAITVDCGFAVIQPFLRNR